MSDGTDTILITSRFRGPPTSANGGYACGRLAAFVDGSTVTVRLASPPPLETSLSVERTSDGAVLRDGDTVVATARAGSLDLEPPAPPPRPATLEAESRYRGFEHHPFAGCFVCGPARTVGDGLRIFAAPVTGAENVVAATWTPHASLADSQDEHVPNEHVWAALDCPGAFSFWSPAEGAVLLGELTVRIDARATIGAPYLLTGWEIDRAGRKHHTGTALWDDRGGLVALGRATWFEVTLPPDSPQE